MNLDLFIDKLMDAGWLNTVMLFCGFLIYGWLKYSKDKMSCKLNTETLDFNTRIWLRNNNGHLIFSFIMTFMAYVSVYLEGHMSPVIAGVVGLGGTSLFSLIFRNVKLLNKIVKQP